MNFSSDKITNRRGMTIVVVFGFLIVVLLLGLSLNFSTRSQRGMSYHAYYNEIAYQFGNAALSAAAHHTLLRLRNPKDELAQTLFNADLSEISLPTFNHDQNEDLLVLADRFPGISAVVTGRLHSVEDLGGMFPDSREFKGVLELNALVQYREVSKSITWQRQVKVTNVVPALISRFTLFVKNLDSTRVNNITASSSGLTSSGRPTVLINGEGEKIDEYGWIYLGGGKHILNIQRGEENYGEDFHLPDTLTSSPFFPNQMYSLLHLNTGFYGNAGEEPIFKRFPVKNSFTSSCLRLYGCSAISAQASPTLIFGDVWRRYLQAAAVAPVVEGRLEKIVPLDWILKHQDVPRELGMPPFLFLSPPLYQVYMSQTREEPFNRSWDHIFSSEEQPPGLHLKHRYKKRFGNPYPLIDSTFDLANVNGDIIYNGKLAHFDMARSVEPKISEVFESVADLMDLRSEKGDGGRQITLNGFVLIKGNRSDLRPFCPLTVSGRGSMVFEGDLSIGDIFLADPEKDLCSVISLAGSIQLSGTHFDCGFAALKGKIIPGTSKIRGFIACDKVNPDLLRGGSTIQYDSRINPEQPSWNSFYTLSLSPRVSLFRVE